MGQQRPDIRLMENAFVELISNALMPLQAGGTIEGMCLIEEDSVVMTELPYPDARIDRLCDTLLQMSHAYENTGNPMKRVCLCFDKGNLLVLRQDTLLLGLVFPDMNDVEVLANVAKSCMIGAVAQAAPKADGPTRVTRSQMVREPLPIDANAVMMPPAIPVSLEDRQRWDKFKSRLERVLSKVLGQGQAAAMMEREVAGYFKSDVTIPNLSDYLPFTEHMISKVPLKNKQKFLLAEMRDIIDEMS